MKERKARRAQNPRTLEKVDVPAKCVVKFKVGRQMRERVCEHVPEPPAIPPPVAPVEPTPEPPAKPRKNSPF